MRTLRHLTLTIAAIAAVNLSNSQAQAFSEGTNVLGVGVGIGGAYSGIGFSGSSVSQTPAIGLHFDHGMGDLGPGTWGLGGYLGYKKLSYDETFNFGNTFNYDYSWTYLIVGARGSWHYNDWHANDKLDTYGGLMLAYNAVTYKDNTKYPQGFNNTYSYSGSSIGLSLFLGTRYFFSENIGAFAEVGYGVATLQLGLAAKL